MECRRIWSQPASAHQRGSPYPPSAMKARYAAFVTGSVSIQNAAVSRSCAGRSLSSDHGSAEVPIVNGPAGMRTSGAPGGS